MRTTPTVLCLVTSLLCGCTAGDPGGPGPQVAGADETDRDGPFLASLPRWGRYIVLEELHRVIPAYRAETQAVIDRIDALPPGTVEESTRLDEVPIPDLFVPGQEALSEVLDQAMFTQGRTEEDVAWLRNSAVELERLEKDVAALRDSSANPPEFDQHLTNQSFSHPDNGRIEITLGVAAVSRFFCNLDVRIVDEPTGPFFVEAVEDCD